jgi:hypothetical protein
MCYKILLKVRVCNSESRRHFVACLKVLKLVLISVYITRLLNPGGSNLSHKEIKLSHSTTPLRISEAGLYCTYRSLEFKLSYISATYVC